MVLWYNHPKYTPEYVSGQLAEICTKARRETRRMVCMAMAATTLMAAIQAFYLMELLGA
ncbi:hypothetical protein [Pseudodesulfovibrio sp.]|uniref:hypothetical protein n=1 Tax=unclassified Pseudodesulfovibrio TaxID=2661612 RepID=UPI003AFF95A9